MEQTKYYYCQKCGKTLSANNFYTSNNLEKFPNDGKLPQCKNCLTLHLDNWDPDTYLPILEDLDIPYIPDEWNSIMQKYCTDPAKVKGTTVLGRYISKMKLNQNKNYRWKDNEFIQQLKEKEAKEAMERQGMEYAKIVETLSQGACVPAPPRPAEPITPPEPVNPNAGLALQIESEMIADLTEEDRRYLCLKWGKEYTPDEWIRLEELYNKMLDSYEIEQAGDLNTLQLACKASLKANQLLDLGDIDGAQKAGKMYDTFMKSGKWTASQKEKDIEVVDSVGEIVLICEREGFIPRYYADGPQDKIDRTLQDIKEYTCRLIENETGLATMISRANKQIEAEEEKLKAAAESGEDADEATLFNYEETAFEDEDYAEFNEYIEIERSLEE